MPPKTTLPADICLIVEGAYPYIAGGVSAWTHDLIKMQAPLTFSIVALVGPDSPTELAYELPPNVVELKTLRLQRLPRGTTSLSEREEAALFETLARTLVRFQERADLDDLAAILDALKPQRKKLGQRLLLDSPAAWRLLLGMYQNTMPKSSFLDYFWSWRGLFGGLYSVLLAELPQVRIYHALCTGYAGLLLARAHLETGAPCLVTEHGIYTNERRIEIASADWLDDPHRFDLSVQASAHNRGLKDFWIDTFCNYSRFCYEASVRIITLYEGNQAFQRMDGADPGKLCVIPNGIDASRYANIRRVPHPPTVALIGRVVPIKDIKTYIKAVHRLKQTIPDLHAYIMGPSDEDPDYAQECRALVAHLGLRDTLIFTGKVKIEDYFGAIDVLVLTSLSEAQPLVILEAGAAGIPTVATDVGSCREMVLGSSREEPALGPGGAIVPLASSQAVAEALHQLLTDRAYYEQCSSAIRERVRRSYAKEDQRRAYEGLYRGLMGEEERREVA